MKKVERCKQNKVREIKVVGKKCVDFYKKKMTLLLWNVPKWQNNSTTMERREYLLFYHIFVFLFNKLG